MNHQRDMSATEGYPNRFGATEKGEPSLLLAGLIICSLPRAKRIPRFSHDPPTTTISTDEDRPLCAINQ